MQSKKPFVAATNLGKVGFGILRVSHSGINYEHLTVNNDYTVESIDNIFLDKEKRNRSKEGEEL